MAIEEAFPGKHQSFMLIQAGYPLIRDRSHYLEKDGDTKGLPAGSEQTEGILKIRREKYPNSFVVPHNGIGVGPETSSSGRACHPRGKERSAPGCPNRWVLEQHELGVPTGWQTNNTERVANNTDLDRAFRNVADHTSGRFLEIYEQRVWEANQRGGALDKSGSGRTLAEWDSWLRERAEVSNTFTFTFDAPESKATVLSPKRCNEDRSVGVIQIRQGVAPALDLNEHEARRTRCLMPSF